MPLAAEQVQRAAGERAPSPQRTYGIGLVGAVLALLGFGVLAVLAIAPFRSADESAHVGYAVAIWDGRLPTLDDTAIPRFPGQPKVRLHVANHPPLYYLLVAPPLNLGLRSGHPVAGLRLARVETLLFAAVGVLAAASVATAVRQRPEVAVGTAAITATVASFVAVSSTVMNDAPAMMFSTVALAGLVRVVLSGLRPGPVAAVAVGAVGALASRASGAALVGLVLGGLVIGGFLHVRPRWRGLLAGVACAVGLLVVGAAAIGWFYARNVRLYGGPTGGTYLPPRPAALATLTDFLTPPRWYVDFAERLWCGREGCESPGMSALAKVALGFVSLAAGVGGVSGLRRMIAGRGRPSGPMLVVVAMFAGLVGSLWIAIAVHVTHTGAPHPRYLFGALCVLALAVAGGLRAVPGGPPGLWLVAGIWAQAVMVLAWLVAIARLQHPAGILDQLPTAVRDAGVPLPAAVTTLLLGLAAAGLILASRSILILARTSADQAVTGPR